jgi:hypothetical protein
VRACTLGADEREPFSKSTPPARRCSRSASATCATTAASQRQPTAAANFSRLVERLREQAPNAGYDDRLNTRAGQLQLLGERLTPEAHLEIAALLLARTLERVAPAA